MKLVIFEDTSIGYHKIEVFGGGSYYIRDVLKKYGFKWDPESKKWIFKKYEVYAGLLENLLDAIKAELKKQGFEWKIVKKWMNNPAWDMEMKYLIVYEVAVHLNRIFIYKFISNYIGYGLVHHGFLSPPPRLREPGAPLGEERFINQSPSPHNFERHRKTHHDTESYNLMFLPPDPSGPCAPRAGRGGNHDQEPPVSNR